MLTVTGGTNATVSTSLLNTTTGTSTAVANEEIKPFGSTFFVSAPTRIGDQRMLAIDGGVFVFSGTTGELTWRWDATQ